MCDRLWFFAEGGKTCLPNLKVCLYYQRRKHDYGHACNDWHECFWLNWFYPVRVKSLQPDIVVPLTFEDWNAGRDAAYLLASELAGSPHRRQPPKNRLRPKSILGRPWPIGCAGATKGNASMHTWANAVLETAALSDY